MACFNRLLRFIVYFFWLVPLAGVAAQQSQPPPEQKPPTPAAQPAPASSNSAPAQPIPAAPTAQPQPKNEAPNPDAVAPASPVITLANLCPAASKTAPAARRAGCSTTITRAEFDKLIDAINPKMPPQARGQVAQGYARLLVMITAAQKRGLENDPKIATLLKLARMQALAQEFNKRLQADAGNVTPAQMQEYYQDHQQRFQEAKLLRVFVPKLSGERQLEPAKQKELAEKLRAAAASGGDFAALQKQAYTDSGLTQALPPSDMGVRRAGTLSPTQNEIVFALKAGEISPVLEDQSGFYVYKIESRSVLPLASAEQEIKQTVARRNYQNALRDIFQPVKPKLNAQYFGSEAMSWNLGAAGAEEPEGEEGERERPAPPTPVPPPKPVPKPEPK